jgi:hypothetical protein
MRGDACTFASPSFCGLRNSATGCTVSSSPAEKPRAHSWTDSTTSGTTLAARALTALKATTYYAHQAASPLVGAESCQLQRSYRGEDVPFSQLFCACSYSLDAQGAASRRKPLKPPSCGGGPPCVVRGCACSPSNASWSSVAYDSLASASSLSAGVLPLSAASNCRCRWLLLRRATIVTAAALLFNALFVLLRRTPYSQARRPPHVQELWRVLPNAENHTRASSKHLLHGPEGGHGIRHRLELLLQLRRLLRVLLPDALRHAL